MTTRLYYDYQDHEMDGNGWNIVDNGSIAVRFPTCAAAIAWCDLNGVDLDYGQCDCGAEYDPYSRFDHDADTGECWDCSDRWPESMSKDEWDAYLRGEEIDA